MRLPLSIVKRAVYGRLHTDMPDTPFYEAVPPDADPPFGIIADFRLETVPTKADELLAVSGSVYLWTRSEGMDQVEQLATSVKKSLDRADLDLSADGFKNFYHRCTSILEPPSLSDGTNFYQQITLNYTWKIQDLATR